MQVRPLTSNHLKMAPRPSICFKLALLLVVLLQSVLEVSSTLSQEYSELLSETACAVQILKTADQALADKRTQLRSDSGNRKLKAQIDSLLIR